MAVEIVAAASDARLREARALFEEYAEWIGIDLEYQGFAKELAELPGRYAPPSGRLLLALVDGEAAGCVALRRLDVETAEVKRLFVRARGRERGVGRALMEALLREARAAGYARVRLDTLPSMTSARTIYAAMGFREIAPYYPSPVEGTTFLELPLANERGSASR